MKYQNPIIYSDYSDPDVLSYGKGFFMVSSSFNYFPSVPVLYSENLVEWKVVNYVIEDIDLEIFNSVRHGEGAWAPSIRFYDGWFYCLIPFPDQGVYMCKTKNPFEKWSKPHLLIEGKGIIDPCPIWTDNKCYVACAFAKSRIGFNSVIGLYEVSLDLTENLSKDYKIIYDGHDNNPTIEGPKFYYRKGFYYILAPAGGVKTGWQVALRSKNVYGPYESKIVLMQSDTAVNGPHQGALIDLYGDFNYFLHFQDKNEYGRILHLQPVKWINGWPIIGNIKDEKLAGAPVTGGDYPVDIKTDFSIKTTFDFTKKEIFPLQTPARNKDGYKFDKGLILSCDKFDGNLSEYTKVLTQKVAFKDFSVSAKCKLSFDKDTDKAGLIVLGTEYAYACVTKIGEKLFAQAVVGKFCDAEKVKESFEISDAEVEFMIKAKNSGGKLKYKLGICGKFFKTQFIAHKGRWIGARLGIFARSNENSKGFSEFFNFCQEKIKK